MIDKIFARELRRLQRLPERSLYRQTLKASRSLERGLTQGMSSGAGQGGPHKVAVEVLWLLGAAMAASVLGFVLFYLIGAFLLEEFTALALGLGVAKFYFVLVASCFLGIYLTRLTVWAMKNAF